MYKVFSTMYPDEAEKKLNELADQGYLLKFCFETPTSTMFVMEKLKPLSPLAEAEDILMATGGKR